MKNRPKNENTASDMGRLLERGLWLSTVSNS